MRLQQRRWRRRQLQHDDEAQGAQAAQVRRMSARDSSRRNLRATIYLEGKEKVSCSMADDTERSERTARIARAYKARRRHKSKPDKAALKGDLVSGAATGLVGFLSALSQQPIVIVLAGLLSGLAGALLFHFVVTPLVKFIWSVPLEEHVAQAEELHQLREQIGKTPKLSFSHDALSATTAMSGGGARTYVQIVPICIDAPANGCVAYLNEVRRWSAEFQRWEETAINEPLALEWSMRGANPTTLRPGIHQRLNLCWADTAGKVCPAAVMSFRHDVLNLKDRFRFFVTISGDGVVSKSVSIDVTFDGHWDRPQTQVNAP